jgi:XRE family transcriptional regulator, regulator of sulfur utilization
MELGEKLKSIRKDLRDYTLQKVSNDTTISVSFLSDIERCRTRPSLETLQKLASYYEVNLSDILEDTMETKINEQDLYPSGLRELIAEEELDGGVVEVLLLMNRRGKKRLDTKEDWKTYYYSIKGLMGR